MATGVWDGMPPEHRSFVQSLPSTGRSVSSLATTSAPPMQMFFLQSRGVWPWTDVPSAVLLMPHMPVALQVRWWHSVSVPGQSLGCRHCTHAGAEPLPLQRVPSLWLHTVPEASGGFEKMPALHRSCVQALPSTGLSVSSLTVVD